MLFRFGTHGELVTVSSNNRSAHLSFDGSFSAGVAGASIDRDLRTQVHTIAYTLCNPDVHATKTAAFFQDCG